MVTGGRLRVLYAGTYEREYPRNALTITALRRAGCDVRELHVAVSERTRDKSAAFMQPASLARLAARLVVSYGRLIVRFLLALRHTDLVAVGYIGQGDMLVLGPIARLAGRPVLFNPLVTLTDTLIEDRGLVRPRSLAGRLVTLADKLSLCLASAVLVDTPENGAYLSARFGTPKSKIFPLPVGADEDLFQPKARVTDRSRSGAMVQARAQSSQRLSSSSVMTSESVNLAEGTSDSLQVLFYGKMIPLHGIETVVRAARVLKGEHEITFDVIGTGQLGEAARDLAKTLNLNNVHFSDWTPYSELPKRIAQAQVVLGVFGETDKAARVVPNKVYQAMATGAAIITRDSPASRRVLENGRSALLVPPADPEALARAILRLRDRSLRDELGSGARAAFERTGSIQAMAESLIPVIDRLSHGRAGD